MVEGFPEKLRFAHNHTSGDTTPSQEDLLVTKRILQCADIRYPGVASSLKLAPELFGSCVKRGFLPVGPFSCRLAEILAIPVFRCKRLRTIVLLWLHFATRAEVAVTS